MFKNRLERKLLVVMAGLFLLVLIVLVIIFSSVVINELGYLFMDREVDANIVMNEQSHAIDAPNENKSSNNLGKTIIPVDTNFGIIVPKIGVNAEVIKDVNPLDRNEYLNKLKNGVAHSRLAGLPSDKKNTFIFAHSSNSFYSLKDYNTVFYLLHKLNKGDIFYLTYQKRLYKYEVQNLEMVDKYQTKYLYSEKNDSSVTLMTCWPPGTDKKRLLVFGKLISVD
jgi:LPXTG-site transpeptidase (sortase) family protein